MGYFTASASEQAEYRRQQQQRNDQEAARVEDKRRKLAAKIVMIVVDKIIADIVRPGPVAEERECYEMAGEVRALIPELENLAKRIIDVNEGVE